MKTVKYYKPSFDDKYEEEFPESVRPVDTISIDRLVELEEEMFNDMDFD